MIVCRNVSFSHCSLSHAKRSLSHSSLFILHCLNVHSSFSSAPIIFARFPIGSSSLLINNSRFLPPSCGLPTIPISKVHPSNAPRAESQFILRCNRLAVALPYCLTIEIAFEFRVFAAHRRLAPTYHPQAPQNRRLHVVLCRFGVLAFLLRHDLFHFFAFKLFAPERHHAINFFVATKQPCKRIGVPDSGERNNISPRPNNDSAPDVSRMTRLSMPDTANEMRAGNLL